MVKIHRIKCGNGNCYVIEENGSAILVDTGKMEHRSIIEKEITKFPIKLILLTHTHFDHCENADYFSKLFQVPIAINQEDLGLIKNNMQQSLQADRFLGKLVLKASLDSFHKVAMDFVPTVFLKDGDCLDQYGVHAKILGLPGHTKGSIGVDCNEAGIIVGDALMNLIYPTISMLYWDKNLVLESAKRIEQKGDVLIYFGHGKPKKNRRWTNSH